MNIYESTYKEIACLCMESGLLKAVFIPQQGAKLASLIDKRTGRELIYQNNETIAYRTQPYDGDYLSGECSGFDDMFPTIEKCCYEAFPWLGAVLPDHGEVWSLAWEYEIKDAVVFAVTGVRLPYRLEKKVLYPKENILRWEYTLTNCSNYDMDVLWAGHIMLEPEKGCRMIFPPEMKKAVCTYSESGTIGRFGEEFEFPVTEYNEKSDISVYRGKDADDYQKFYFKEKFQSGWCGVEYPDGRNLTVRFPVNEVPYCGAVNGEGGTLDLRCIILEPCTAYFDRPDLAKKFGADCSLKGKSSKRWYLEIELGERGIEK